MKPDLNALSVFAVVAEMRSFRAAADQLGVTRPAISQTIRRLEEELGLTLLFRTTRSVSLTEAGEQLYTQIAPLLSEMRASLSNAGEFAGQPRGLLRLAVSSIAESFISGRLLADFIQRHLQVHLDVVVTDQEFDIVAEGYDAAVRLGEVIDADMIAVPVSGDLRQLAVCSPAYLQDHGRPEHPRDLARHRCIGWRPAPRIAPYRWEFADNGREFSVAVAPEVTTNDMRLMIGMALAGGGITFGIEDSFSWWIERGELVPLLEDYCPRFPGFSLYYPSRRQVTPKLRALIDHVKGFAGQSAKDDSAP